MESLLDIILRLLGGDEELKEAYEADPEGFAEKYFGELGADDWNDLSLALDQSSVVQRDIDFSRSYDTGGNVAVASSGYDPSYVESGHAVTQLHHIVNNYSYVDDRDTITDQSTNQVINTGGGDFWQSIDNEATTASGDGAVAAGDDINGDVNTGIIDNSDNSIDNSIDNSVDVSGDGNIVGDENVVGNSQDNSVVDVDLNVAGGNIDNSQDNDGVDIDVADSFNDNSSDDDTTVTIDDHSDDDVVDDKDLVDVDDSFNDNSDNSTDNSINDSFNTTDSFNATDSFNDNDGVDDDSTNEQTGLLNVNDVLSHNSVPVDVDVLS